MKIATWNIERLKHVKKLDEITSVLREIDTDVLVLTESDERIRLDNFPFQIATTGLVGNGSVHYSATERRVKIYSKFEILAQIPTWDPATSCCVLLKTGHGNLAVYGTIIGVLGNGKGFKESLSAQIEDYKKISDAQNLCVTGDFNISFGDNYYFTKNGRDVLNAFFGEKQIANLTGKLAEAVDHIAVSRDFLKGVKTEIREWNLDKKLSDHKGVCVELKFDKTKKVVEV